MRDKILFFALGALSGAIGGFVAGRAITIDGANKRADQEIETLRKHYETKMMYAGISVSREDEETDPEEDNEVNPVMSKEERDEVRRKLQENYKKTTDYANYYVDDSDETEDQKEVEEALEVQEERVANKKKLPEIVRGNAVGDVPPYFEELSMFYYTENGVLMTEAGDHIPNVEEVLGPDFLKLNFEGEEEVIHVANYALDTLFEVNIILDEFIMDEEDE